MFQYLFNIFAGLQGLFILGFHCLWDPKLWRYMQLRQERKRYVPPLANQQDVTH